MPRRKGTYVPPDDVVIAQKKPIGIELVEGEKYAWCACGRSNKQPFCDGSHKGTGITPVVFVADISGLASLCGCKRSDNAPFCNGRHNDL
ncbi:MAG: CDGSH iron-sulfur domain-containing protein [Alphaproteobacteria bacterium]|nr:CDGSH iron-sulfur domain-containing protein [Alphaproteobacteria bacterium]MCZ6509465.1 CDGSH iron-sulfur domain-containing protein [Alphaproteobacteria bacterium]MCZ6587371.1 CDGSH iron-sulfur domain-containing protein [Alphaproteobacteria bacterium]MCZ6591617.1 CDGSH iron-sulfur domain-containing protein [Alphaproteobacteria bacterium]MCZ6840483.1 CDGSH iron-sulfur domain-containing protein [Alphaproteobacteria bacterium]